MFLCDNIVVWLMCDYIAVWLYDVIILFDTFRHDYNTADYLFFKLILRLVQK